MLTGHCLSTASQSSFPFSGSRRKTIASSSASKRASKYSPGDAGAREAGTVKRRFESGVTIIVGLSHFAPSRSIFTMPTNAYDNAYDAYGMLHLRIPPLIDA